MELIPTNCPQCTAPISILRGQKHVRCEHCGSYFVVNWNDKVVPSLVKFESILDKIVDNTKFLAADKRLSYIGENISEAKNELSKRQNEYRATEERQKKLREESEQLISTVETTMWVSGSVLLFSLILVFFGSKWWLFLTLPLIVLIEALFIHRSNVVSEIPSKQKSAQTVINLAKQNITEAQMRLDDLLLEQDFCQKTVHKFRFDER